MAPKRSARVEAPAYLQAAARRPWSEWLAEVQGDGEPLALSEGSRLGPMLRRLPPKDMRLPTGDLDASKLARFELRPLLDLPEPAADAARRAPITAAARRERLAERMAAADAAAQAQSAQEALVQLERIEAEVCTLAKAVHDARPAVADERRWIPPQPKAQPNRERAGLLLDDANVAQLEAWEREYRLYGRAVAAVKALRLAIVAELARRRSGDAPAAAALAERARRDAAAAREEMRLRAEALEATIFQLAVAVEAARPAGVAENNWLRDTGGLQPRRVAMLLSQASNRKQIDDWIYRHSTELAFAGNACLHELARALGEYAQLLAQLEQVRATQQAQQQKRKRKEEDGAVAGSSAGAKKARGRAAAG